LAEGLQAPAEARAWVARALPVLPREVSEDVLLVVSELVTNAVRHGGSSIELVLSVLPDCVRVAVTDSGAALPVVAGGQPAIDRPTGRGLLIVAATARDWGIDRAATEQGKTVWAEVATPT
jgi:anti-sigma regulatory factor (Ser/Thr protein kinase)